MARPVHISDTSLKFVNCRKFTELQTDVFCGLILRGCCHGRCWF